MFRDFPGGPVVKNPPSNAGHSGSIPGWGTKMAHTMEPLSLCTTSREDCALQLLSPGSREHALQQEKQSSTAKTQCSQKKNNK